MTKQERVWRAIKDAGCRLRAHEIADILGLPILAVSEALHNMRARGVVFITRGGGRSTTYALPPKAKYPCIGKGNAPASRKNLANPNWRVGFAKCTPGNPKSKRKPKPAIALEQAWGWGV
jgi:hypothetical protein